MHRILTNVQRSSGSYTDSDSTVVASVFNSQKAQSTLTILPLSLNFYELDCLSIEERAWQNWSHDLQHKIRAKGFTPFYPVVSGEIVRGKAFELSPDQMKEIADNNIEQQKLSSGYIEELFGYWNVYEMDYERLEKTLNITGNVVLGLKIYSGFTIVKVRIVERSGNPVENGGTITITDIDNTTTVLSTDLNGGMDNEYEVLVSAESELDLKVFCDNWDNGSVDVYIKHVINQ